MFFNEGWVAYDDRQNFLLEADIGVSTHLDHVETEFSFRTRILDYLWASLPVVATGGDSFGDIIDTFGIGLTVPPGDVDALEAALFRLLDEPEFAASCSAASGRLAERVPVVVGAAAAHRVLPVPAPGAGPRGPGHGGGDPVDQREPPGDRRRSQGVRQGGAQRRPEVVGAQERWARRSAPSLPT